ncbi:DUF6520 family protein [Flavitalea sp. BT771]|uniref:DUF6520 family protein n=1 Tax=Flavitalea sp. BT771 TaxID=3063329 RepID=UPI0026E204D1|nr:DUF6520 family protein [Flavitalea sp. BT771]MDO6432275.1 DUF6520 family protein [Flavitalea sp. BT771]MDV6221185.1 DUF6520 family protein [Flavitalea sp. BT771]
MKKIKWTLMTLAVGLSIGGAFATRLHQDCLGATQYYFNGGYVLAGRMGIDYICNTPSSNICTYYKVGSTYTPCCWGNYCTSNCKAGNPVPKKAKN